jgi:hypothetical protein
VLPFSLFSGQLLADRNWGAPSCGRAVTLAFEGLPAANVDLDLLGRGFRFLGEIDLQHILPSEETKRKKLQIG